MKRTVPETHRVTLEQIAIELHETDHSFVITRYHKISHTLSKEAPQKTFNTLIHQVEQLVGLLESGKNLTERERNLAVAALKYFLKDEDLIHDDHWAGLVDDALVVQAAWNELHHHIDG